MSRTSTGQGTSGRSCGDGGTGRDTSGRADPWDAGPVSFERARRAGLVEVVSHEDGVPVWDLTERGERFVGAIRADAPPSVVERIVSG